MQAGTIDARRALARSKLLRAAVLGLAALLLTMMPMPAFAAEGFDGRGLSLWWALPFAGILLCIATGPVLYPHLWEHHFDKFAMFWSACVIVPLYLMLPAGAVTTTLAHTAFLEYMPFILLLLALFTVAGGIYLEGNLHDSVYTNTVLLGIGTLMASLVGTTGASMILIRPLIRANDDRRFNAHVVVFFIFLVSNVGGALTPLGDPPLFIGFLKGVDFFWTTKHLLVETAFVAVILLVLFFLVDLYFHRRESGLRALKDPTPDSALRLHGKINFILIGVIIAAILMSASWKPGISFHIAGVELELQGLLRDAIFVAVTFASLALTRQSDREANGFSWGPIKEVAILFACIFICIAPVIAILHAGRDGALAPLVAIVTNADGSANNAAYFWTTGILSSFLDNAPTYLVFFELAGGDPKTLMTTGAVTLAAISTGAVFMGANTYIGNAPNFMVYAIARQAGVKMPSFFGYMLWSGAILIPIFLLVTFIFF
jgi:Na+/H+ antiporter NhaD/arsenite permease-like protein